MRLIGLMAILSIAAPAFASDAFLPYVGRLADVGGNPINGDLNPRITLYSDSSGTTDVWRKQFTTTFSDGYFEVDLTGDDDDAQPRSLDVALANEALWVGVSLDGTTDLAPLKRMSSTGFIRLSDVTEACVTGLSGALRYRTNIVQVCDGSSWIAIYTPAFDATGGTVTQVGGQTIHPFTSSGTFTPNIEGTVRFFWSAAVARAAQA